MDFVDSVDLAPIIHSSGKAARCVRFCCEIEFDLDSEGLGVTLFARSAPNVRAALVKARGLRGLGACTSVGGRVKTGAGEISIGSQSSFPDGRVMVWRGGELRDTVEAKDSSRSEERKSSTSSRGRW
jgi:hypothetical protein